MLTELDTLRYPRGLDPSQPITALNDKLQTMFLYLPILGESGILSTTIINVCLEPRRGERQAKSYFG